MKIMEKKYIKVPFDVEMAKRIQNKECEGRIATKKDYHIRVVCWDRKGPVPIIGLIDIGDGSESMEHYYSNGVSLHKHDEENGWNLMLEVPEYMTFKDGDVLTTEDNRTFILCLREDGGFSYYAGTSTENGLLVNLAPPTYVYNNKNKCRRATEEEKQKLIDALKASKDPKAKDCLKRFFGIEEKPKYEFKPKDWVLCRSGDEWCLCRFSHKTMRFDGVLMFVTVGGIAYEQCIPYNEQTAHLIGKTDDWKE